MNLHRTTTEFNAAIDLHTKNMYFCAMDRDGKILCHREIKGNSLPHLDRLLEPYAGRVTVCCESTANWYFLHDHLVGRGIPFVLGHSLYITAISKSKKKNDREDSRRLADLLRTNNLPTGYACPKPVREIRDLCRRRSFLVEHRSSFKASLTMSTYGEGGEPLDKLDKTPSRRREAYLSRASTPVGKVSCEIMLDTLTLLDGQIKRIEKEIERLIQSDTSHKAQFAILESFPGIGKTLGASIMLEIAEIDRFESHRELVSYARLITPQGTSDGKNCGARGSKIGNAHLKYAIVEAAVCATRVNPTLRNYVAWLADKHGSRNARHIFAHRYGIAIYFALKRQTPFDLTAFFKGKAVSKFTPKEDKADPVTQN